MQLRATASHIDANTPDAVAGLFSGLHRAQYRGRGLEFDEVRAYLPGDDYRALDWRVTARSGTLHTKVFHEERERTLYLIIDASPSMHFGTRHCFKWVLAARTAALFAWLEIANGDRVGGVVFGEGHRCLTTGTGGGEAAATRLFRLLSEVQHGREGGHRSRLSDALDHVRHHAPPGNAILILSDFQNLGDGVNERLAALARYQQFAAILIHDPLEARLPHAGPLCFTDGRQQVTLDAHSARLRADFEAQFQTHMEKTHRLFRRYGIPLLTLETAEPWPETLVRRLRP